ncbi:MAG: UDP-glucose 4-epimerase GalE, partial [Cyanobium sp.]
MANILITGGAGFIGSHVCLELLNAGHSLVVLDNFTNSGPESLRRVAELAGLPGWQGCGPGLWSTEPTPSRFTLIAGDVRSPDDLQRAFRPAEAAPGPIEAVLHFAGLKAVGESVAHPLAYWDVNVGGSRALLEAMEAVGCRTMVFSSSATLYGHPETVPIAETAPLRPINPYGHTKAAVEQMLADVAASRPGWRIARLRYFNPVGAHPSGCIGEDPNGPPNNLFPLISRVAAGRSPRLQVYGSDWPTPDGTGIRDYIHVMDLAECHGAALALLLGEAPQLLTFNLGSGRGHSVLEMVRAFEQASGRPVPFDLVDRRPGDSAVSVADPAEAERRMGWRSRRDLAAICRDGWAWQSANP